MIKTDFFSIPHGLRHDSEDDWDDASAPPADYLERVQVGFDHRVVKKHLYLAILR